MEEDYIKMLEIYDEAIAGYGDESVNVPEHLQELYDNNKLSQEQAKEIFDYNDCNKEEIKLMQEALEEARW